MRKLVYNALQLPNGEVIQSRHRYDFVWSTDRTVAIDGGLEYQRLVGDFNTCTDISLYSDDPIELTREKVTWGTYGKDGKGPLTWVLVKDMDTEHLKAVIEYPGVNPGIQEVMQKELIFRS